MRPRPLATAAWALLVLLVVGVLVGPRPRIDPSVSRPLIPDTPAALTAYLASGEARFGDIVPGVEKTVIWADPTDPARTELAVVYLHGFSATHRETAPLTEQLAKELGANAFLTRLAGHGRTGEALGEAVANDWLADVAEALEIGSHLGRRVVVFAVSTGATLATWAAAQPEWRDQIAALALMSPNYGVRDERAWILTLPWGAQIATVLEGEQFSTRSANDLQRHYWTDEFPTKVLPEMAALTRLINEDLVAGITAPTLVFLSPNDRVIDPRTAEAGVLGFGSSDFELIKVTEDEDPANHILAGDILSPSTTDAVMTRIVDFVSQAVR